jgi:hypothetical protein
MARFTTTGGSGDGTPGAPGTPGEDGADAIWNYTGEYSGGAAYAVGDLATYDGQLWYRANANGGNVGDTPAQGFIWNLLAAKGADGTNGSSGLVYLGNYISGNGYITDLAVVRGSDNNLYIAKANGGLADPVGNTAEWDIFSKNSTFVIGGERNKVLVSDEERLVLVSTRPPGEEVSENQWVFGSDGLLTGPAPDSLIKVNGLYGKDADPLFLLAPDTVVISGDGGEFLDDPTVADNQIATIGDLPTGATGTFQTSDSKMVTVTNGIITSIESLT